MTRITGTLHGDQYTFWTIYRSVLVRMRNVLERKSNHKLHFRYIFFFENRSVYEIMWKNSVDSGRLQMTIWRIAYWIRRATNTLSKHVILIAFPLLHWLNERALVLRYMYIASLFHSCNC